MFQQLTAAFLGFFITLAIMPWVIRIAHKYDILDYPNEERRVHDDPIPRIGGVALFASALVAAAIVIGWEFFHGSFRLPLGPALPGVLLGCVIVFVTGLIDDVRGVTPALKLTTQTIAALCAIAYGFRIETVTLAGNGFFSLGFLSVPITILWIVGMTNAFNLIDGIDGLAGTMALIGLASCIGIDVLLHDVSGLVTIFALVGAVFGFLRYNRTPARIFLGDSGSMLLGFILSIATVHAATPDSHVTFALLPLFALAYPLTDTSISIARRWLRNQPISRADGRHVHHQILSLGLSPKRTVELLGLFFFSVALMGMSIVLAPPRVTLALGTAGFVLMFAAFFYGIRWLRYSEFLEFGASVTSVLLNARSHVRHKVLAGELAQRLIKADSIEQLSALLDEAATELDLLEVSIITGAASSLRPKLQQISPLSARPFRIDYPIAWEEAGHTHELLLRVWCERPHERLHVGAERIAMRLGAALEEWVREHPASLGIAGHVVAKP
jgi:UDP-GlcNAc:undecaprenyl-phosphate GlcNAc-1-phosphate transferase